MITSEVNVSELKELAGRMLTLQEADSLLREISTTMLAITRERIHEAGLNANGSSIGEYSDRYLKLRESNNLGTDRQVRLFFTGQMQNDYTVVDISDTEYGLGFQNQLNADKADWSEDRFGKIYALTSSELDQVSAIVAEFVANTFK
jgi:hypothetical protein